MYDIVCLTYDIVYDICKNYDIVVFFTGSCQSYIRYRIRYCIRYLMPNVRYRMSDVRYRIRHLQKLRYRRYFVQVLANRIYDIVYDIVYDILVFDDIVYDMQMECRYYTISYAYIVCYVGIIRYRTPIYTKTYVKTIRCRT